MSVKSETVVDDWEGIDDTEVSVPTFRTYICEKKNECILLAKIKKKENTRQARAIAMHVSHAGQRVSLWAFFRNPLIGPNYILQEISSRFRNHVQYV